eukprot:11933184-Alexandrium_andersonii.AAC.1
MVERAPSSKSPAPGGAPSSVAPLRSSTSFCKRAVWSGVRSMRAVAPRALRAGRSRRSAGGGGGGSR